MFKTFFFTELRYTLKQPMVYIFALLFALIGFASMASSNFSVGGQAPNVFKNAPHLLAQLTAAMSLIGLLVAAAFINNAALRDYSYNFNEILFSTPLNKFGYFFGRFLGAVLVSTVPLIGLFFGMILGANIGVLAGWDDADRFMDFQFYTMVNNYFLFVLPNMFIAGAIIFSLAITFRSTVISFVGALLILMIYIISGTLMSDIDNELLGATVDMFGIRTYGLMSKYYTTVDKNTLNPSFSGLLLFNRVLWMGIGLAVVVFTYFKFSFQEKNKKVKENKEVESSESRSFPFPTITFAYNSSTEWIQFKSFFKINFLSIYKSTLFKILFFFSAILLFTNLYGGFDYMGIQAYPVTYKVMDTIDGSTVLFLVIILVFFSGELIWRDRENKINEVIDASPHTSFISMAAKALSLVTITSLLNMFFIVIGILYQLFNGYTRIDLDVYLINFMGGNLMTFIIWSGVMIMIQVLINNKYIGYFVSILILFMWSMMLEMMDVSSSMLTIGSSPSIRYSDMSGFGPGVLGAVWFNIYWVLFALISLLIAGALWNRGSSSALKERILIAKKQVPKSYRLVIVGVFGIWVLVAGFVYYNTQVLNPYYSSDYVEEFRADYEKKYKKYEDVALPKVTDIKYFVDIFPEERDVYVRAVLELTNPTNQAIDSIHYSIDDDWSPEITIPNATLAVNDKKFQYQIYTLSSPLAPGETIQIEIKTKYITQGFKNGKGNTSILENGTFLNNFDILPSLGYKASFELSDKQKRKKYDLAPKERMAKLEPNCTGNCMSNYLTSGHSDYINAETVISTSKDQIAIAPGSLIKKWEENDRVYSHYKVDHISQNFYSFMSARYEVATRKWNGVDIEVYYDKNHSVNVEMMLNATQRALENYTQMFGPYYHKQCRIIEFPRYATFAQAFPGSMPYSEAFGFVANLEDESKNNVIDAVIAHEMGHQWWAHQVVGADMQGGTFMSEAFAEYSSLMTLKKMDGDPMKMRTFTKYDHDRYLRGRSFESKKELPLYKVENQGYIHYGKGSVILFALQDYIGEEKVNLAMKNFLEEYRYKEPPYPTSLDFLRHLEPVVPDSFQYLITDWFKEITLYDNRLKEATYEELPNGKFEITLKIESVKLKADSLGTETKVPMNDWVDIGLFADSDEKDLMYQKRVKLDQPKMTFTIVVDSLPAKAGVDPRHILIDRVYSDNIKNVSEK